MSDKSMAEIGRKLAEALSVWARSRSDDSRKEIARLHTELCQAWLNERAEASTDMDPPLPLAR